MIDYLKFWAAKVLLDFGIFVALLVVIVAVCLVIEVHQRRTRRHVD